MGRQFEITYWAVLAKVVQGLEASQIPYMIVGGLAAAYYGIPRATFDIDMVIAVDPKEPEPLVAILRRLQFDLSLDLARQLLRISNRIPTMRPGGLRLDLWLIRSEYDRVAFARRKRATFSPRLKAWIATAEDTILSKLIAGRARDFEDTIGVLETQKDRLDWAYLLSWAKRLDLTKELGQVRRKQV